MTMSKIGVVIIRIPPTIEIFLFNSSSRNTFSEDFRIKPELNKIKIIEDIAGIRNSISELNVKPTSLELKSKLRVKPQVQN